jgi:hypothetical protein
MLALGNFVDYWQVAKNRKLPVQNEHPKPAAKAFHKFFLADFLPELGRGLARNLPEDLGLLDKVLFEKIAI